MDFEGVKKFALNKLVKDLDPRIVYHNAEHTIDVLESAMRLARMEKLNGHDLTLLKTACVLHDIGMLKTYVGHEDASAEFAGKYLPGYGYSAADIKIINDMIIATRLPQGANGLLEELICDADLDYLGRTDFYMVSLRLKYEWDTLGVNPTTLKEWYQIQVDFLSEHQFFTASANKLRLEGKERHLEEIREICSFLK